MISVEEIGNKVLAEIKGAPWFPYKTGNLKFNATSGRMISDKTYLIHFDGTIAPYVAALENGSTPHDIPGAFGKDFPFGIGGKFDGKFHPGSKKHQGFISNKCINTIIDFIVTRYEGTCYDIVK